MSTESRRTRVTRTRDIRTDENREHVRVVRGRFLEQRRKVAGPLRRGVFLVPATITSLGLLSGFYSAISAIDGHFELAAVMILVAFVCDGLDGRVARLSRTSSQFGVEYDSLSDVVAFGMAPAILAYTWALHPIGTLGIAVSGLFVVCAALRLARFNVQVETVDKRRFVGLPVPGAAIMIAGSALAYSYFEFSSPRVLCLVAVPLTLALGWLMISRVPYPSFKGIDFKRRAQVELLIGVLVVIAFLFALPQLTAFILATAFVLSGPYLMMRGEELHEKVPVMRPMSKSGAGAQSPADPHKTGPLGQSPHP
ncbi:MAG: CDP-diacylglycerol--serine O-phosphatidyltransferase [Candidatus Binataceae bacterium]